MRARATFFFTLLLLSSAVACGESHDASEDGGSDGSMVMLMDGGGTTGTDGGSAGTDGGIVIGDGGGGTTDGGEVTTDGGVTIRPDSGSSGTLSCGMDTCDAATEQCCITGSMGSASATCISIGDPCMGGTAACDGPEDCDSGEACCGTGGGGGFSVSCVPAMMCGGFTSFELCHTASDCADGMDMCCPFAAMGISASICAPRCFGTTP